VLLNCLIKIADKLIT